jgi:hypothetical protein
LETKKICDSTEGRSTVADLRPAATKAAGGRLRPEQRGDQVAAQEEEYRHAQAARNDPAETGMADEHDQDGDRPDAVQLPDERHFQLTARGNVLHVPPNVSRPIGCERPHGQSLPPATAALPGQPDRASCQLRLRPHNHPMMLAGAPQYGSTAPLDWRRQPD